MRRPPQSELLTLCTGVQAKAWESGSSCGYFLKGEGTDGHSAVLTQALYLTLSRVHTGNTNTSTHPLSFCLSTENFSVSRCLSCDQSVPCKDGPVTGQKQPNAFTYSFIVDKVCPLSFTFPTRLGSTVTAEQMEVQKPLPNSVPGWQSHSG